VQPAAFRSTPLRLLAFAALAAGCAWISNRIGPSPRRLVWSSSALALPAPVIPPSTPAPAPAPEAPVPPPGPARKTRPAPSPAAPEKSASPPSTPAPVQSPITEIAESEAWRAFQSGTPFLDARRSAAFAEGHIPGAWSTPVWEADLDDRLIDFKAARHPGPEDPIVIYCSGGDCRDSHLLAARLLNEGYFRLLIFRDGFPAWAAQGRPIEKGRP
jgi:rhodanese-related sulfurtransferase